MGTMIFWGLLVFATIRGIIYLYSYPVKTRKKIEALKVSDGFSAVNRDTVQELRNVINFLLEREHDLDVLSHLCLTNDLYLCDKKFIKNKCHPKLLAFVRAAHLAGFTVSVRQKGKAEQERASNAETFISEYVSEIQEDNTDYKRIQEVDRKKHKYGYIK